MNSISNHNRTKRYRVLVSAYACHPEWGSEPGMGWKWIIHLAQYHDLWVLTEEERFAPAVRKALQEMPEIQNHVHVVGVPRWRFGENLWSHLYYFSYRQWQWRAYQKAMELHRQVDFDIVHQLNMIGYREPGFLWKLPLPFVWGPIGGHAQMPLAFFSILDRKSAFFHGVRNVLNAVQMWTAPRVRQAARKAKILVAATREDKAAIWRIHNRCSILFNEVCTAPASSQRSSAEIDNQSPRPLRLSWCGLFLGRKMLPIGLYALKRVIEAGTLAKLDIVGYGPCEREWHMLSKRIGIDHACVWHGKLPYSDCVTS